MTETRVEDIYTRLKSKLVGFGIRPGERMNEVALARELNVSRTPLREALNRLMAEHLVEFRPGSGFFCRALEPQTIYDLYELRRILETSAVMLACHRADDAGLRALEADTRARGLDITGLTVAQATERDEAFHIHIARLSGNAELARQLQTINDRTRFIRWVNMAARIKASKQEHRDILRAMMQRDADRAGDLLSAHISQRLDQVVDAVKEGISSIYMGQADALMSRVLEEAS